MRVEYILSLIAIGVSTLIHAAEPTPELGSAADREALRSTFERWIAAYSKRDLAGTIAIFADDVVFSFQGSPDGKKGDLEKSYREEFAHPEEPRVWVPQFEEFDCSGNLGFVRSTWRLEVITPEGKVEVKARNRSIDILRRSADGSWRIFRSLNYPLIPKK
jgi:uncharacterized protein (TIGR02246 family)